MKPSIPKKSASLLLLRPCPPSKISFFNYDILVLRRSQKMTFGSAVVFPGGKIQPEADQNFRTRYSLSHKLESTSLRQTFEETGLFFARKPIVESDKLSQLNKIRLDYIVNTFNEKNGTKQISFQRLSELLGPSQSMVPFIRMITVPFLKSRYDTTFFILPLQQYKYINFFKYAQKQSHLHNIDQILPCSHQFTDFRWMNPAQILNQHFSKKSVVAPPQFIMLDVMLRFRKYHQFMDYLRRLNSGEKNTTKNHNLGPNIISLIKNRGSSAEKYPYAATLVGDRQFPYDSIIQHQTCTQLKQQVVELKQHMIEKGSNNLNRFLFKQGKRFFDTEFEVICDDQESVITQMEGWSDVRQSISQLVL